MRIDRTTIGRYICRASVKGYREIDSEAELFMKGPPRILTDTAIAYGRVGSNVELGKYLKWASIKTTLKILTLIFIFLFQYAMLLAFPLPETSFG